MALAVPGAHGRVGVRTRSECAQKGNVRMKRAWTDLVWLGPASAILVATALAACGGDDGNATGDDDDDSTSSSGGASSGANSSSGGGSSGGAISAAECSSRCEARATECDVPSGQIDSLCTNLCSGSLSDAALACIEALPCSAGEDEISQCQRENPVGSSSSSGGSSSGSPTGTPGTLRIEGTYSQAPQKVSGVWLHSWEDQDVQVTPDVGVAGGPDLREGTQRVKNLPSGCEVDYKVSLGGVSKHSLVGQATVDNAACDSFFENLDTLEIEVTDAPYDNGDTADVTIVLSAP